MSTKYEESIKVLMERFSTDPAYIQLIMAVNPNAKPWEEIALICFTAGYVSAIGAVAADELSQLTRPYKFKKESEQTE